MANTCSDELIPRAITRCKKSETHLIFELPVLHSRASDSMEIASDLLLCEDLESQ